MLIELFGIYHTKMFRIHLFVGRFSLLLVCVWALLALLKITDPPDCCHIYGHKGNKSQLNGKENETHHSSNEIIISPTVLLTT
jgi:hypothetical protein